MGDRIVTRLDDEQALRLGVLAGLVAEFTLKADEAHRDGHPAERHRWSHLADRAADLYRTVEELETL